VCHSLSARAYSDCRKNDLFPDVFRLSSTRFSTKKIVLNTLNLDFWTTLEFSRLHPILKKVNFKINRLILKVGLTEA